MSKELLTRDTLNRVTNIEMEIRELKDTVNSNHQIVIEHLARMDTYSKMVKWFVGTPFGMAIVYGLYKMGLHNDLAPHINGN